MGIPLSQAATIGTYVVRQHLRGRKRYPLVLMLEPLFRCNLACAGCGKIDYPDEILNQRLSVRRCLDAIDECGAPVVVDRRRRAAAAQGDAARSSRASIARKQVRHRSAPTRCCWRRRSTSTSRSPYLHLVDPSRRRPGDARQVGLPGRRLRQGGRRRSSCAKAKGFRVNINCTLFNDADPRARRRLLRHGEGAGRRRHHRFAGLCL